jgi:hypothetical protein
MPQHYAGIAMLFDGKVGNERAVIFPVPLANDWWTLDVWGLSKIPEIKIIKPTHQLHACKATPKIIVKRLFTSMCESMVARARLPLQERDLYTSSQLMEIRSRESPRILAPENVQYIVTLTATLAEVGS